MHSESESESCSESATRSRFETCYAVFRPLVFHTAYKLIRSRSDAEDIAQDVFSRIWERRCVLDIPALNGAYFARAARNAALHRLEGRQRRLRLRRAMLAGAPDGSQVNEAAWQDDELEGLVAPVLAALPQRARQAFELRWRGQLTNREVAQQLGIRVKAAEKLLARARRNLRPLADVLADRATPD